MFNAKDYCSAGGCVERTSSTEAPPDKKSQLLKDCFLHFCGEQPQLEDFEFEGEGEEDLDKDEWVSCCCSQPIKHPYYITHKASAKRFRIGNNCFANLFGDAVKDNLFFKTNCKNGCREKVPNKKSNHGKLGSCSKKCMNIWNKKINCVICSCRFWRINPSHKLCKKCYFASFYGVSGDADYNIR